MMRRYLEIHQKCVAQTVQGFGGFVAKTANSPQTQPLGKRTKSSLEGEEVVNRVGGGRWFIVKRPAQGAMIGLGTPAKAEALAPEAGCFVTSSQVALRRNLW